jgi:two-component system, cell cycle sensor histidine kinase and response regulator CckA
MPSRDRSSASGRRRRGAAPARGRSAAWQAELDALFDTMFEGVQIIDFDWRYVYLNRTAADHGRRARDDLIGRRMMDAYPGIERTEMFGLLGRCMTERVPHQMVNPFTYPDGRTAWFDLRINPIPLGVLVLSVDVSAQHAMEEQLRRSREDLATTLECMVDGVITTDVEGRITRMNPAAQALTGWSEADGLGRRLDELVRFLNHQTQAPVEHAVERVLQDGLKIGLANDTVLVRRDGTAVPIASSGAPIRDADGATRGVVLLLKDMKQEYELTSMLQQSQKMEAVGRLAGGVAHDFNNLLTVITSYADILLQDLGPQDPRRDDLQEIHKAAASAAALTRQLLAFSRQQVLEPRVLAVNEVVAGIQKLLARLLGEDVEVVTALAPGLDAVRADPGQLEQVIVNLAVNARDAMPQGGELTLETANVEMDETYLRDHPVAKAGAYVMLAVSDTGTGMDRETQRRIFEPFFTTKEAGKGTGLGLATVYGIVRQSGGFIWVYSEPGHGTTFKIYLPRVDEPVATALERTAVGRTPRGRETILLVEDAAAVRAVTRALLERLGYVVLEAPHGEAALHLAAKHHGPIDLLLTDVVMPGLGGRPLAERLLAARPELRVLYASGYTDDAVVRHGVLETGIAYLQKPFTSEALARKVREVLERPRGPHPPSGAPA